MGSLHERPNIEVDLLAIDHPNVEIAINFDATLTELRLRNKQEAVLKATAVRSPLLVMSSILPCPCLWLHRGGGCQVQGRGRGV